MWVCVCVCCAVLCYVMLYYVVLRFCFVLCVLPIAVSGMHFVYPGFAHVFMSRGATGRVRLPLLLQGWDVVARIGWPGDDVLDREASFTATVEPVYVLRWHGDVAGVNLPSEL